MTEAIHGDVSAKPETREVSATNGGMVPRVGSMSRSWRRCCIATRVALTLGYASPSPFVAAFRSELGSPPREFMRS